MAINTSDTIAGTMQEPKLHSFWADVFIRLFREKLLGTVGLVIVLVLFFTGIFADFLARHPMNKIDLQHILAPPSGAHFLGTDNLGRDELDQIIYGARISLIVGLSATFLTTIVSIIIGSSSALIGGRYDIVMQRFVDAWLCIPPLLILLTIMSILDRSLFNMILAIALPQGIGASRMIRSAVFSMKENPYVEAGRAIGCNTWTMLYRHIIPNIMAYIIIGFSMGIGGTILMESGLSFLGFGVPPGVPSWGSMLSQEGRTYMEIEPMLAIWPGLALSLVVYGTNMFGDAMRDLLDPRLKGGLGSYAGAPKKKIPIQTKI